MSDHARFAPSSADRQELCPGSVGLEEVLPNSDNDYSAEGTAAHDLASRVLQARIDGDFTHIGDARTHIGKAIVVGDRTFIVDDAMAEHVDRYATDCMIYSRNPGALREVEQRVYFGQYLGVPDEEAFGTSDFIGLLFDEEEIVCVDFKYGMGVKVFAEENRQMMRYALGVLNKYELIADFKKVRLVVHQPRLDHVDEWPCSVEDLLAYAEKAKGVIDIIGGASWAECDWPTKFASDTGPLVPGDKQCKFCLAKPTCPALRATINDVALVTADVDDFADLTAIPSLAKVPSDALGAAMDKVGLLEDLAKAIRAETERRLLNDEPVDSPQGGYKIVQGKRGNRQWSSDEEAEAALKSFRLKGDLIYTYKLKGPAPIEKLLAKESPTRWKRISKLIVQPEGKPSVAPMSDGRPAITRAHVALDFEDLTDG